MVQRGQGSCGKCPVLQAFTVAQHQAGKGSQTLQQGQGFSRKAQDVAASMQIETLQSLHACTYNRPYLGFEGAGAGRKVCGVYMCTLAQHAAAESMQLKLYSANVACR